ncbi:MAG: hypothetical protein OXF02_02440 [Simkaniaceae bacterium]|nr:hypothetical protein [Simkaniaceae bacterium]
MLSESEREVTAELAKSDIQEPFLFRTLFRARRISDLLIDEKGNFSVKPLPSFEDGIRGENDRWVSDRFAKVVHTLSSNKELLTLFHRFRASLPNRYARRLILCSLGLSQGGRITDREVRRSILTALLVPLRQNVGSCFATAPAILIQSEQPEQLLLDLYDLITSGSLSRTFGGVKQTVPISPGWGTGDLKKPVFRSAPEVLASPGIVAALRAAHVSPAQARRALTEREVMTVEELFRRAIRLSPAPKERVEMLEQSARDVFKGFTDHALLKVWEYTLASFADYKVEFFRWNLYVSLGFDREQPGGIGRLLYEAIANKLHDSDRTAETLHREYLLARSQAQAAVTLLRQASNRDRIRQLNAELTLRLHDAGLSKDLSDKASERGQFLSGLFALLIDHYAKKFPEYFQEIYDAEMFDAVTDIYQDAPAGFRLLYKHGRQDPLAWTLIYDARGYVEALKSFFRATEPDIPASCKGKEEKRDIEELTTLLLHHLDTDTFVRSAIERMNEAYEKREGKRGSARKPWSYVSGGTMHSLLSCYYRVEKHFSEEVGKIGSPMELSVFLLDVMKGLPPRRTRLFEEDPSRGMLMYSPTHAFVFKPGLLPFAEGWRDPGFSYTWVRDRAVIPGKTFYDAVLLDAPEQKFLGARFFTKHIPPPTAKRLATEFPPLHTRLSIPLFRTHLFDFLKLELKTISPTLYELFDGFMRTAFPLVDQEKLRLLLAEHAPDTCTQHPLHTAQEVYDLLFDITASFDETDAIFKKHALTAPSPILFADTNWSRFFFGIGYNPGIEALDLWRIDRRCREGYPMATWRPATNGTSTEKWGVLCAPEEYSESRPPDFTLLKYRV